MATLKDLIRAETLKVGSNGAMPSDQVVDIVNKKDFVSSGSDTLEYIAPCDGVLSAFLQANPKEGTTNFPGADINTDSHRRHAVRTTDGSVHMSLSKGTKAYVAYYDAYKLVPQWIVRFTKTIGGGYKRYLSSLSRSRFGGAPWLRLKTASETLRRPEACSPLRRQGGFLTRPLSTRGTWRGDTKPLLQLVSSSSSLSPLTSASGISKTRRHTPILVGRLSVSTQEQVTCPVIRAIRSRTTWARQTAKLRTLASLRSTSFLLSEASNNARMEVAA